MIDAEKNNIILIGFMGSGKTVIGRRLAGLLDYGFADTDEEIRDVTGLDLQTLFRKHGEIRFRSEERLIINKLASRERTVIACGGSLPPVEENLRRLNQSGHMVLLTADSAVIRSRLKRKNTRLLLSSAVKEEDILIQTALWEKAVEPYIDFRLDSGSMEVEQAARLLAEHYQKELLSVK